MRHELTADGSSTLYSSQFNAHYHSTHGALTESKHVFIDAGLSYLSQSIIPIRVLEYGFGTGLNAILAHEYSQSHQRKIYYDTIEAYPISSELVPLLNYGDTSADLITRPFHELSWHEKHQLSDLFIFTKYHSTFEDFSNDQCYDIIFYDAFGPGTQPELWDEESMGRCFNKLEKDGILVTFCAKGSFKRALKSVGFSVESLPGPPGKREMTRAIKK